jgi:hypothetical protein
MVRKSILALAATFMTLSAFSATLAVLSGSTGMETVVA